MKHKQQFRLLVFSVRLMFKIKDGYKLELKKLETMNYLAA